jgi:hypothetical protein
MTPGVARQYSRQFVGQVEGDGTEHLYKSKFINFSVWCIVFWSMGQLKVGKFCPINGQPVRGGGMAFFLIDYAAKKKEEAIPGR